jgi:16S rRNA (adenine1518-N6/adenine1519-N6)-dimethyltransferase
VEQRSQQSLLRDYGIKPVKKRGQNFLVDGNLARSIAQDTLALGDRVLELGAGGGALTTHLLTGAKHVVCVEVDRHLCALLRSEFGELNNFELVEADLAKLDWFETVKLTSGRPVIAGNLPYVLTSKVLFALAELRDVTSGAVFMVQKEVAERMVATPGTKSFGILAAVLGAVFEMNIIRTVPSSVFWPKPDVESAIVSLVPKSDTLEPWPDDEFQTYRQTVKTLFGQRRKKLRNQLRHHYQLNGEEVDAMGVQLGLDLERRPEQCSVADFRIIARTLAARENS